jgi:uncharacterized protein (UPF0248 family)
LVRTCFCNSLSKSKIPIRIQKKTVSKITVQFTHIEISVNDVKRAQCCMMELSEVAVPLHRTISILKNKWSEVYFDSFNLNFSFIHH